MMTYRQMQERMHFEPRKPYAWKILPSDVPLASAELDGAVITAYREGYFLVEMDGHRTAFSAFKDPSLRATTDLNMRLSMKTYLDLDWRIWPLVYGTYRIVREQRKRQTEWETPLYDRFRKENNPDADIQNASRQRQVEDSVIIRDLVRILRETIIAGMTLRWQETANLRFLEGRSRKTVAEETGCSLAVMRAMEYRIRNQILERMEHYDLL